MVEYAKAHAYKEINKEVARRNPKAPPRTKIKPISEDQYSMQMGIDEEFKILLERTESVLAQKTSKHPTKQEALISAMKTYLYYNDPVEKAKRAKPQTCAHSGRKQKASERHAVNLRDEGRCTHIDQEGHRCSTDRWVDIHHIKPVMDGGTNHPDNLTTLCWFHHGQQHY